MYIMYKYVRRTKDNYRTVLNMLFMQSEIGIIFLKIIYTHAYIMFTAKVEYYCILNIGSLDRWRGRGVEGEGKRDCRITSFTHTHTYIYICIL